MKFNKIWNLRYARSITRYDQVVTRDDQVVTVLVENMATPGAVRQQRWRDKKKARLVEEREQQSKLEQLSKFEENGYLVFDVVPSTLSAGAFIFSVSPKI